MKSTRFYAIIVGAVLLLSVAASAIFLGGRTEGKIANVYQDGVCIHTVDLSQVVQGYTLEVTGAVTNVIAVERGRISVTEADCPDQVCVHQGWISTSVVPVVCLPNGLVIQMENVPGGDVDGLSR